jgi:hypothetical protein
MNTISCPASYSRWLDERAPFYRGSIGATRAIAVFQLTSIVPGDYDNVQITLTDTLGVATIFELYVDPAPPVVPGVQYINLTGLVTLASIAAAIIAVVDGFAAGYTVRYSAAELAAGTFTIVQERAGSAGNTQITYLGADAGITVNGFALYNETAFFYGGQSLLIPLLWSPQRGFGPTTANTPRGEGGGG